MQGLLSIKLWGIIAGRLMNAIYPTVLILLLFSFKEVRRVWKTPCFRFFMVVAALEAFTRLFIFFMGVPYQGRYLYAIAIFACIPAGAGLLELARIAEPYLKKIGLFKNIAAVTVILVIVFAVNSGKGLISKGDKKYLDAIPALVKENCPPGVRPVIVSEINDIRIGYYAKAEILILSYEGSSGKYVPVKKGWCIWNPDSRPVQGKYLPVAKSDDMKGLPSAFGHFKDKNVFLVVMMDDPGFRVNFGTDSSLKHLNTFKDDRGRPVSVYKEGKIQK
ncbi:MAG: hypothetical protein WC637_09010 [Victivallales bacterium]|jgi:hypothetical protein